MRDVFGQPELCAALLSGMQDGVSILDGHGVLAFVNDALCQMTGFERSDLIGTTAPFPHWPPEELARMKQLFQRTLSGDRSSFELVFRHKDDRRIPVIVSPSVLRGADGGILGYIATVKDISDRKRLEQALIESEQRWRSIAENPFDFVVVIDREHRYLYVNHMAPGITRESLIGKATPFDFIAREYHDVVREAFHTVFTRGRATSYEVYSEHLDRWYSSIVGPIREHGKVTSASILTRDITQQKRAEEALRRSEQQLREAHKMETIGTLAGGIAHDLNNMLTPILAYSDLAQLSVAADHTLQPHLRAINDAAERARDLVQRILLFSRRTEPQKRVIDLGDRVREALKLLGATIPPNIELCLELPNEPVWVLADRTQLDQVLANLATNSLQAMVEAGGTLRIVVRQVELPAQHGDLSPPAGPGSYAALSVIDTGPGLDLETQRRAFEPFFTTRPTGAGTGLGLSIVHGIVREHGGNVSLVSSPGQGATFTVYLPNVSAAETRPDSTPSPTDEPPERALRVLCVDDQAAVAEVARQALAQRGHSVSVVTNSTDALALIAADPGAFDLLLTDQSMPQLKGTALILAARAVRPDLVCLLMTGRGDEETTDATRAPGIGPVLRKPFSAAGLVSAVERAARQTQATSHG